MLFWSIDRLKRRAPINFQRVSLLKCVVLSLLVLRMWFPFAISIAFVRFNDGETSHDLQWESIEMSRSNFAVFVSPLRWKFANIYCIEKYSTKLFSQDANSTDEVVRFDSKKNKIKSFLSARNIFVFMCLQVALIFRGCFAERVCVCVRRNNERKKIPDFYWWQ